MSSHSMTFICDELFESGPAITIRDAHIGPSDQASLMHFSKLRRHAGNPIDCAELLK